MNLNAPIGKYLFQHTAARRRLALYIQTSLFKYGRFNTQPPEGGWFHMPPAASPPHGFQHTAARRRLGQAFLQRGWCRGFNTQPPEGGWDCRFCRRFGYIVSTHSRPKAAGQPLPPPTICWRFQHTAARRRLGMWTATLRITRLSFNTQPPEGGWIRAGTGLLGTNEFQHTAARRRLVKYSE